MKIKFFLSILFLIGLPIVNSVQAQRVVTVPHATKAIVFKNVTVIDGTGYGATTGMTVVVGGEKIESVGKNGTVPIPRGAKVIDGSGRFMIPGLWDMHVHLSDAKASAIPGLLANGITGVRDWEATLRKLTNGGYGSRTRRWLAREYFALGR